MKSNVNSILRTQRGTLLFFIVILLLAPAAVAQPTKKPLAIEIYKLDNGLTVYLNEDHALPSIFGAVAVKGGSTRDPADATGIAHYFEHIMFKGTDSIGTLDYTAEKVYLDSISALYDQLDAATGDEARNKIQAEINRISLKAAEYAIPNELDKILKEMGSTRINAGTSNEEIVYYNIFPTNQVEKWLKVYSHRFIHPVYRLFQSELETVYEEYNMYKDNRFSNVLEEFTLANYPNHPYGVPILGNPDDLKNPSLKKMDEYFRTYYVANNMGLILSGNFNKEDVKPLISKYFGSWRSGEIPPMPGNYSIEPFKGRTVVQKKLSPVKIGIRSYRSVPIGNKDEPVLNVISEILSNQSQTGLMDDLVVNHKLMMLSASSMRFTQTGSEVIIFVPKIVGQSLKSAEKLMEEKLEELKTGRFDDELLEAVKTQIIVNYERNFEDQYSRGYKMITAFVRDRPWQEILDYPEQIKVITREDVVRAAQKYYGPDYLVFYSKTGFQKKAETLKPPFKPIPSVNTGQKSAFAKEVESMPVPETALNFIEYGPPGNESNEVTVTDLNPMTHLYYVKNEVNELFDLSIRFGIGAYEMPILSQTSEYMNLVGTENLPLKKISGALQKLGASYQFFSSQDDFIVHLSGLDANLDKVLELVAGLIYHPKPDETKISNLVITAEARDKIETEEAGSLGQALYMFAVYGNHSRYLNRLTTKEIKKLKTDSLHISLKKATHVETDIHYSGTLGLTELEGILKARLQLDSIRIKSNSPPRQDFRIYDTSVVYFLNDKKAIQSKNYFFLPGEIVKGEDKPYLIAYMEYLDGGMQSIIFQEIREFRSLAYSTGAFTRGAFYEDERVGLSAFVGTQADKSKEAIAVMYHILTTPPEKSDRLDMVKKSLIQSINSDKPGFRSVSSFAEHLIKQHYTTDPRKQWVEAYKRMSFDDIVGLYKGQFYKKPSVITIIGDKEKIGTDWLGGYGKVIEVKKEDIFRK
ncbi:MAG: insulinase family protein [Bacteroidetes bacterium]|nr:insulinase family protein [Bacteroidota bacterium]